MWWCLGFKVVQNFNGFPEWKELEEAKLKEKEVYTANKCKVKLINHANKIIIPLQDALDLGIALESEKLQLSAWKKYRVILNRVDTSTAPDIIWPVYP
ncbi:tail fiber assembly protein [Providencia rettgeri]